jgi:hypothetical protein
MAVRKKKIAPKLPQLKISAIRHHYEKDAGEYHVSIEMDYQTFCDLCEFVTFDALNLPVEYPDD